MDTQAHSENQIAIKVAFAMTIAMMIHPPCDLSTDAHLVH